MKSDEDVIAELAKETFTRDEYNAYNVRLGQRNLIQNALRNLKSWRSIKKGRNILYGIYCYEDRGERVLDVWYICGIELK